MALDAHALRGQAGFEVDGHGEGAHGEVGEEEAGECVGACEGPGNGRAGNGLVSREEGGGVGDGGGGGAGGCCGGEGEEEGGEEVDDGVGIHAGDLVSEELGELVVEGKVL